MAHRLDVARTVARALSTTWHGMCPIFHLDLGHLWRCSVSWCTQWKGTPQDCADHIRKKHFVEDSVKAANIGRWFPPWTVTRAVWHMALKSKVSGISTDAVLFSANGTQLVHHYRVFGQCAVYVLLCGPFMKNLRYFTARASAEAKWIARRSRTRGTGSPTSSRSQESLPRSIRQRGRTTIPRLAKPPGRCPRS